MVGVDIETTGLDFNRDKILGIGVGRKFVNRQNGEVCDVPDNGSLHNGKFDVKFLAKDAGDKDVARWPYTFDTMLAASLLIDRPQYLDLASLSEHYLKRPMTEKEKVNAKKMAEEWEHNPEKVIGRCLEDVSVTEQLAEILRKKLTQQGSLKFFETKVMPAARMLADVEYRGMRVDLIAMGAAKKELQETLFALSARLKEILGNINLNSPKQLLPALATQGIHPVKRDYKTGQSKPSTDKNVLKYFAHHPAVAPLLEYKQKTKLLSFIVSWEELIYEGRLYPTYNMCKGPSMDDDSGARTGRLSCSNPNLQQIPRDKRMRSLLVPSEGSVFVISDESQIEPRVLAHYSEDPTLIRDFKNEIDPYGSFAVDVLGALCHPNECKDKYPQLRKVAKECILSIVYGIGGQKLSDRIYIQTGIRLTVAECKKIIGDYFRKRPKLKELRGRLERTVIARHQKEGFGYITNLYGRKVVIDLDRIYSTGVNTLIQSTASDIVLFSQLPLLSNPYGFKLVALVHDEAVWEGPGEHAEAFKKLLEETMTAGVEKELGLSVPLKVESAIGNSWAAKQ